MAIEHLDSVLKYFRGVEMTPDEKDNLFCETLFMTLARATGSDTNIAAVEVEKVQEIIKRETGRDIAAKDIRVEAISHAFETAPFDKLLGKVRSSLDTVKRATVAHALAELIRADDNISPFEVDFFNQVVRSLDLKPADLAGLGS